MILLLARHSTKHQMLILTTYSPFAHARGYSADNWTKAQRRIFTNDFENLLEVEGATNRDKSDKTPHEWLAPQKSY